MLINHHHTQTKEMMPTLLVEHPTIHLKHLALRILTRSKAANCSLSLLASRSTSRHLFSVALLAPAAPLGAAPEPEAMAMGPAVQELRGNDEELRGKRTRS